MLKKHIKKAITLSLATIMSVGLMAGCGNKNQQGVPTESKLSGNVVIDGSSTVFPISEAVGEEFNKINPGVNITIGTSGTGGGMEKLLRGEIDIADASRSIKDEEKATAEKSGIKYKELTIANDGITVVVNPQNDWAKDITTEELKMIWEPNSKVKKWSDVRAEWPNEEIKLYGPGSESGTFEYFTEAIVGEAGAIRTDYTASEDDNVLVQGVSGDKNSMGFFGYAYYFENQDKLKEVAVNGIAPTQETIQDGTYKPLSRPLFLYVNEKSMNDKPEVKAFIEFYLGEGRSIVPEVGYVALPDDDYDKQLNAIEGK